jgi:type II secretory ATPase GspE/PulE/Tfp pilus assembly ATPase PilB-like protein
MRDLETAEIGIRAALTGHLVFSTLHTNDAPSAIARLVDMGAEDYLLASSILGILAQRLVRVICKNCKEEEKIEKVFLREVGLSEETTVYHGIGCAECSETGFLGRLGIFELMTMNEEIRSLTIKNADSARLGKAALETGMISLREDGLQKVRQGLTTVSEVIRVTQDS